jgi:hypothetical protein
VELIVISRTRKLKTYIKKNRPKNANNPGKKRRPTADILQPKRVKNKIERNKNNKLVPDDLISSVYDFSILYLLLSSVFPQVLFSLRLETIFWNLVPDLLSENSSISTP